jgi:hypothetical protein
VLDGGGIDAFPQGNIRPKDLHPDRIIHGHPLLGKDRSEPLEQQAQFLIQAGWRHAGLRIDAHVPGEIEGVPDLDGITEADGGAPRQDKVASGFWAWRAFPGSVLSLNLGDEATI